MDNFELPHAKLLYVIYDLAQKKQISISERSRLKGCGHIELVIAGDSVIFSMISAYEQSKDSDTLYTALKQLVRSPRLKPKIAIPPKAGTSDETTSPLDTFLQSRKKVRDRGPKLNMDNPTPVITEAHEEGEGIEADEGKGNLRSD